MPSRHVIVSAALDCVTLLLNLGKNSYREDIIADEGNRLVVSPLAGMNARPERVTATMVGPNGGAGIYHVIINCICAGHVVNAYCKVVCDETRPRVVDVSIYTQGLQLTSRSVSVDRDTGLVPWGMPKGFDLAAVLTALRLASAPTP